MVVDFHTGITVPLSGDIGCGCGPHSRTIHVSSTQMKPDGLTMAVTIDGVTTHVILSQEEAVALTIALLRERSLAVNGHG